MVIPRVGPKRNDLETQNAQAAIYGLNAIIVKFKTVC